MAKYSLALFLTVAVSLLAAAQEKAPGLYAKIDTEKGAITLRLHYELAPLTVLNFVSLAEGTGKATTRPGKFYDGLTFHRCLDDFMIQGGCPQGQGTGGPGYKFRDEILPTLRHAGRGALAMANSGPATNGSQFYITHKATNWLDGKHTVFGQAIDGLEHLDTIKNGTKIKSVSIERVGEKAKAFKTDASAWVAAEAAVAKSVGGVVPAADWEARIGQLFPAGTKDVQGLHSWISREGSGDVPAEGGTVSFHYKAWVLGAAKVIGDSSGKRPYQMTLGQSRDIPAIQDSLAQMKVKEKRYVVAPPALGYGAKGVPGMVPPNATIVLELERTK